MDREKLYNTKHQAAANERGRASVINMRRGQFKGLNALHNVVTGKISELTAGMPSWNEFEELPLGMERIYEGKQSIVVVLEYAPDSEATPNHYAVCVVSTIQGQRVLREGSWPIHERGEHAEFAFAIVPSESIRELQTRTEQHFDELPGVILSGRESSRGRDELMTRPWGDVYSISERDPRAHKGLIQKFDHEFNNITKNLEWILVAMQDEQLNPHLISLVKQ